MSKKRWVVCQMFVVALVTVAVGVGCSWRVGQAWGDTYYIAGAVNATAKESPKQVAEATKKAFGDLDYVITTGERTTLGGMIEGRNRKDQSRKIARVHITEGEKGGTEISIRVDSFGDKKLSHKLLELIRSHLAQANH